MYAYFTCQIVYIYVNYLYIYFYPAIFYMHRHFNVFKLLIDYLPITCLYITKINDNNVICTSIPSDHQISVFHIYIYIF